MSTLRKTSFRIISLTKLLNILVIYSSLAGVKGFQPLSSLFKGIFICRHPAPMQRARRGLRPATPTCPRRGPPANARHGSISRHLHGILARDDTMSRRARSPLRSAEFIRAREQRVRTFASSRLSRGEVCHQILALWSGWGGPCSGELLGCCEFSSRPSTWDAASWLHSRPSGYLEGVLCQPFLGRFPAVTSRHRSPVARGK